MNAARQIGMIVGCALLTVVTVGGAARAVGTELLGNASFEAPAVTAGPLIDAPGAPWVGFNLPESRVTSLAYARTGQQSVQTIGPFDFVGGGAGGHQTVPATPGLVYTGSIFALNPSSDAMLRFDFGFIVLLFLDANLEFVDVGFGTGVLVDGLNRFESPTRLLASSPQDVWTPLAVSGEAPAGTEYARLTFAKVQLGDGRGGFVGGTTYWDDASLTAVPEPGAVCLLLLGAMFFAMLRSWDFVRRGGRRGLVS